MDLARYADEVRALAQGLAARGFSRGDKLAIIGENRPRLYAGMAAAQCLGGVAVPLYEDSVAEEMVFIIDNADIRMALVEDQEQVDKMIEIKDRCSLLEWVVYDDPRGLRHYTQDYLVDYLQMQALGVSLKKLIRSFLINRSTPDAVQILPHYRIPRAPQVSPKAWC